MLASLGAGFAVSAIAAAIASVACLALVRPALVKRLHAGPELSLGHGKLVGQQGVVTERITGARARPDQAGRRDLDRASRTTRPGRSSPAAPSRSWRSAEPRAYVHPVPSLES